MKRNAEEERQAAIDAAIAEMGRDPGRGARRVAHEPHPCPDCGHVRRILVRYAWEDGAWCRGTSTARRCGICSQLARARYYERLAREARDKAAELRARRDRATQRAIGRAR